MGLQKEIHVSPKNKTGENYAKFLELDILIVGGGFSGVYLLYELRKKGYKVKIFEAADGLGGVWKWNQYPGARVDSDIPIYELSIPEVYNTWNWKEKFPGWQELQDYFEHVDKVCDISKDVAYDTRVIDGIFDEKEGKWTIKTEDGRICKCKYFLPCVGFAAKRYFPDWKGLNIFKGTICHSSFWPKEDFDVANKNCAVIGTGSTGVQIIQEWAKKAKKLVVFQRTPNLAIHMKQIKLTSEEQDAERKSYPELFKAREQGYGGYTFPKIGRSVYEDTPEVREKTLQECWDKGNFSYWVANYDNILLDKFSNRVVYDFWVKKVRERLTDPKKMEILAPLEPPHPFGVKRPSLEQDYYEMLDKPNVEIVPVKNNPIVEIKENGIVTADGNFYEVDVIALATGFDALTGSLIDAGIKDVNGTLIKELWKDGCKTFYGITMHGFPNMFFTYGPQAPTSFTNGPTLIEIQARFIMDAIAKMEAEGIKYIDPLPEAQESFVEGIHQAASHTLFPLADSWYMGANIPGKKREMLNYMGGIPRYTEEINELLKQDFIGFNVVKEKA